MNVTLLPGPVQDVLAQYNAELVGDEIIHNHLTQLYDTLMEQNLVRLIEPFSRVEIAHIAGLISLPVAQVEQKLSQVRYRRTKSIVLHISAHEVHYIPYGSVVHCSDWFLLTAKHSCSVIHHVHMDCKSHNGFSYRHANPMPLDA